MSRTSPHWRLLAVLALAALLAIARPFPTRAASQACFPETGFCIDGRFRDYWEQNGGLPVFGFPIGPAQNEISRETGQTYLTQWFERNRFELHPENAAPYDVLLGRLGDDLLRARGIDWQLQPRESGPRAGCLWFEQTGHNVCDQAAGLGFKSYWQTHGLRDPRLDAYGRSLALFGLPLTEARPESNPADGQVYLTQWFERARLEWHPEKPDAYKVLLGLLGNEARASSAEKIAENVVGKPVGNDRALYWFETRGGVPALVGLDIANGRRITLSGQPDSSITPAANHDYVAWVERAPDRQRQYVMMNTIFARIGLPPQVILESGGAVTSQIAGIAFDGSTLYYADYTQGHTGLFARNMETHEEQLIDAKGSGPVAADDTLLWVTGSDNGKSGAEYRVSWTLHMRTLSTGQSRVVTTIPDSPVGGSGEYAVSGDNIVWTFSAPGIDNRVFVYHIGSGTWGPVSPDAAASPSVDGSSIAWATDPYFDRDPEIKWGVQAYDLHTGTIRTIAEGLDVRNQRAVTLAAGRVAYTATNDASAPPALYLTRS